MRLLSSRVCKPSSVRHCIEMSDKTKYACVFPHLVLLWLRDFHYPLI